MRKFMRRCAGTESGRNGPRHFQIQLRPQYGKTGARAYPTAAFAAKGLGELLERTELVGKRWASTSRATSTFLAGAQPSQRAVSAWLASGQRIALRTACDAAIFAAVLSSEPGSRRCWSVREREVEA